MSGGPDNSGGAPPASGPNSDATHQSVPDSSPNFETDFEDVFRFDPFAKNNGEPSEPAAPAPTTAPASASPASASQPSGVPPAPAGNADAGTQAGVVAQPSSAPQVVDPTTAANLAATQALTQAAQNLARVQPQGPSAPPPDPALDYNFQIPQPLVAALTSDDVNTRMQATQAMNAALAREVHTRMRAEMTRYAETQIPQMMQQMLRAHTFRETIKQDFYGKYPQLNNPNLASMIADVTSNVMQAAGPNVSWNDQIRDRIADEIFKIIPALRVQQAAPPAVRPPAAPPAQPPRTFVNGSRPAAGPGGTEADVLDTLGFR